MSNDKSPAFQFYPQDWLSSPRIAMMSLEEQGAYIRLLCYDWTNDGIPKESLLGLSTLKVSSPLVEGCFVGHPYKENFLTNERLLTEREKQKAWKKKCSDAGKKSALKRSKEASKNTSKVSSILVATKQQLTGNSSSSSSSSSSINKNTKKSEIEEIYSAYPKRTGKGSALPKIEKALRSISFTDLLAKVKLYAKSRIGQESQFTPAPTVWFNQERWDDDANTWFEFGIPKEKKVYSQAEQDAHYAERERVANLQS